MFGYIGNSPAYGLFEKQVLTPDGVETDFALSFKVGTANSVLVVKDGLVLESGVGKDYVVTAGGTVINFSVAPLITENVFIVFLGRELLVPKSNDVFDDSSWIPTITGSGGMTVTSLTINEAKFEDRLETVKYKLDLTLTPDGTLDDKLFFTLPVPNNLSENVVSPVQLETATTIENGHLKFESSTQIAILRNGGVNYTNEEYRIMLIGEYDKA